MEEPLNCEAIGGVGQNGEGKIGGERSQFQIHNLICAYHED